MSEEKQTLPHQKQDRQPGIEAEMTPRPTTEDQARESCARLRGKVAIVTGGDSGIGAAICIAFAKEGADIVLAYLNEHEDAQETMRKMQSFGRKCTTIAGDIGDEKHSEQVIKRAMDEFGKIDILVNNAAEQHPQDNIENITAEQLMQTFRTNTFAMFFLTKSALQHMGEGSTIINTASVTAYRGSSHLLDYSSTKGAIVAFTRSLAMNLANK